MTDQVSTKAPHNQHDRNGPPMSLPEKAQKEDLIDITALVRSIQRAEGDPDCFRRPKVDCSRSECKWHAYCLEDTGSL